MSTVSFVCGCKTTYISEIIKHLSKKKAGNCNFYFAIQYILGSNEDYSKKKRIFAAN